MDFCDLSLEYQNDMVRILNEDVDPDIRDIITYLIDAIFHKLEERKIGYSFSQYQRNYTKKLREDSDRFKLYPDGEIEGDDDFINGIVYDGCYRDSIIQLCGDHIGILMEHLTNERNLRMLKVLTGYQMPREILNSSLMGVSKGGHWDMVEILLEAGADPNSYSELGGGRTPLTEASSNVARSPPISSYDMSFEEFSRGYTKDERNMKTCKILIEAGAEVNVHGMYKNTPLIYAITTNDLKYVEYLLSKGADPNLSNKWGETPLMKAVYYGYIEIARCLS